MEIRGEITPRWKTTVIVSATLKNHETSRIIAAQQHRIRFSDGVESRTFIFPLSGTAFLLVEPEDVPGPFQKSGLLERIDKFVHLHRNSFLLLYAPFDGRKELEMLSDIQRRFFGSNLKVLPVRSYADMAKGMLAIAKATSKPHADILSHRMSLARAEVIERSPVWEMLRDIL